MTPDEVILAARRSYNAVTDNFWSDAELYQVLYGALLEVTDEGQANRATYTTPTVAGTQGYDFPTNTIAIKRVTWDGRKLTKIDMIEDDVLTGMNQETTSQGDPEFYWIWDNTIYLRPIPASAADLKLFTYNMQGAISTGSTTIEIPLQYHMRLVNPVRAAIAEKDQNFKAADRFRALWEKDKLEIKKSMRRIERADKFTTVKDEQMVVETYIGG